jgi:hypothetical protein
LEETGIEDEIMTNKFFSTPLINMGTPAPYADMSGPGSRVPTYLPMASPSQFNTPVIPVLTPGIQNAN